MSVEDMAGRFEGLSDLEWKLFNDIFPPEPEKRERGMPHTPFRYVLNTLLYILITGCRWCDVPKGEIWASKSSAHRWLKRWGTDGILESLQARILGIAEERGLINGTLKLSKPKYSQTWLCARQIR